MKKGTFHNFLGRKNPSLFDTNIQIKDMDTVELVLDSTAIPETGTAKVRARPTVKHFSSSTSSTDILQAFAVPTPQVPLTSTFNVPNTNGTGAKLSNGASVPVLAEEDIFIPPPPSMAPPPPPPSIAPPPPPSQLCVPPPPDYSPDPPLYEDLATLQPPSMPPPKPPSRTPSPYSSWIPDHTSLTPPPMAPPKPPSNPSSAEAPAPISTALANSPGCPRFIPPNPPASAERLQAIPPKASKVPPAKPTRLSSISQDSQDNPTRAAPRPTPSSFNPQNTAKLYAAPKPGLLSSRLDLEKPSKPILLLQDTSTDPVPTRVDVKKPQEGKNLGSDKAVTPPTKPARRNSSGVQLEKDLQDLKENLQSTLPAQAVKVQEDKTVTPPPSQPPQELDKPTQPTPTASPVPENTPPATPFSDSPSRRRKLIPYVTRTPYYLRASGSGTTGAASPLALLQAAKEREKQRSSLSRENSSKSNSSREPTTVSIHQSRSSPNSFTVVPRPDLSLSQASRGSPDLGEVPSVETNSGSASPSRPLTPSSVVVELLEKQDTEAAPIAPGAIPAKEANDEEAEVDFSVDFIPPPPEFANSDTEDEIGLENVEPPPSFPPPDPPSQKVLSPSPTPAVQALPISVPPPPTHPPPPRVPSPSPTPAVQPTTIMVPPTPNPPSQKVPSPSPTPAGQALPVSVTPPPTHPPTPKAPSPSPTPAAQPPPSPIPPPSLKPNRAKPPSPPELPVQKAEVMAKPPSQGKPKAQPALPPAHSLSPNQATLLSILQKKMLEMDLKHKCEVHANDDDWGAPEEPAPPKTPSPAPTSKSSPSLPRQTPPGLDMSELEQKVSKKAQDLSTATKPATSNGSHSKQGYGMTFRVRPGTEQPIVPIIKGDAP